MTLAAVARRRHATTGLREATHDTVEDVVRWFGAVQAQEYWPAMWGLTQRLRERLTAGQVEDQLDTAGVVRTHVLRPTWHWVPVTELGWMLQLTGSRVQDKDDYYARQRGMTPELREAALPAIQAVLTGTALTRGQVREALAGAGLPAGSDQLTGPLMGHLMMSAELAGLVCSGPRAGNQHTYALLAERLAATGRAATVLDPEAALRTLVTTFLRSHGPATEVDLRWWSGLLAAEVRQGLQAAGDDVCAEEIDGVRFWSHRQAPQAATEPRGVRLLQGYDEYTVAFTQSKPAILLGVEAAAGTDPDPVHLHTVLDGTQVAGHWKATRSSRTLALDVQLYRDATRRVRAGLEAEARRLADFAGRPEFSVSVRTR